MPYYYVRIRYVSKITGLLESLGGYNMSEEKVRQHIVEPFLSGVPFVFLGKVIDPKLVEEIHIYELNKKVEDILAEMRKKRFTGPGVLIYEDVYASIDGVLEKIRDGEIGKEVTSQFITSLAKVPEERTPREPSRNIFIVHGRDTKPVEELKAMLKEFGLNPIVLQEQPSGSMTIVEKLEKYSNDIGFAFVLLTPDDALVPTTPCVQFDKKNGTIRPLYIYDRKPIFRARQNVILEFGFFIAKLKRDRVCCLYRENTELPYDIPSDMHGIVYIPFKESIGKCRNKIIEELKAAGYEIKDVSK